MTFLPTAGPSRPIVALDLFPELGIREQIVASLADMRNRNPLLRVQFDEASGAINIADRSESKLREICQQLEQHAARPIESGALRVVHVETIRRSAEAEGKYIRQTGGLGNYGHIKIRLEPSRPGEGFAILNEIRSGAVPKEYVLPVTQGILAASESGILAGYEVVDFKATLYDGSFHEVDSNEMAFRIAGSLAFKGAAKKADPVVLEPVMAIEILAPEQEVAMIVRDLHTRRARIENILQQPDSQLIQALAPLRQMLGYADELRSLTEGRASCVMEFLRYEPASHPSPGNDLAGFSVTRPQGPSPRTGSAAVDPDPDGT